MSRKAPTKLILGKYEVAQDKNSVLGEGSFSIVQRGVCVKTGKIIK